MYIPPGVTFSDLNLNEKNWVKLQKERPRDRRRDNSFEDPVSYTILPDVVFGQSALNQELREVRAANQTRREMQEKIGRLLNDRRHVMFEDTSQTQSERARSDFTEVDSQQFPYDLKQQVTGSGHLTKKVSPRCYSFDPSELASTQTEEGKSPIYSRLRSFIPTPSHTPNSSHTPKRSKRARADGSDSSHRRRGGVSFFTEFLASLFHRSGSKRRKSQDMNDNPPTLDSYSSPSPFFHRYHQRKAASIDATRQAISAASSQRTRVKKAQPTRRYEFFDDDVFTTDVTSH